jgi:hypothetical protein
VLINVLHAKPQTLMQEEAQRATKEVAYNMKQRVRQELAYPAVVHFYTWLLHGANFLGFTIYGFASRRRKHLPEQSHEVVS